MAHYPPSSEIIPLLETSPWIQAVQGDAPLTFDSEHPHRYQLTDQETFFSPTSLPAPDVFHSGFFNPSDSYIGDNARPILVPRDSLGIRADKANLSDDDLFTSSVPGSTSTLPSTPSMNVSAGVPCSSYRPWDGLTSVVDCASRTANYPVEAPKAIEFTPQKLKRARNAAAVDIAKIEIVRALSALPDDESSRFKCAWEDVTRASEIRIPSKKMGDLKRKKDITHEEMLVAAAAILRMYFGH